MRRLIILIFIISMISCCDIEKPKEEDLLKYPWIEIFTPGIYDFQGIKHNLDLAEYAFSFKTNYSSIGIFFETVDSGALKHQWEFIDSSTYKRKYRRASSNYKLSKGSEYIELIYNEHTERITFELTH